MTQWGLDALFNPGKRHMDDEKRRLQSTREELGDSSGGRRIDLESGKVSIALPGRPAPAADDDPEVGALDPALEAEEVPAVALEADAEITPELADPAVEGQASEGATADSVAPADTATVAAPSASREPADDQPVEAPVAPSPAPATRRTSRSASAWSRRG
jgi:hypothetical protein